MRAAADPGVTVTPGLNLLRPTFCGRWFRRFRPLLQHAPLASAAINEARYFFALGIAVGEAGPTIERRGFFPEDEDEPSVCFRFTIEG